MESIPISPVIQAKIGEITKRRLELRVQHMRSVVKILCITCSILVLISFVGGCIIGYTYATSGKHITVTN